MSAIQNALIESATLTIERGFILSSFVHLSLGNGGQGFGGYVLGGTPGTAAGDHGDVNYAAEWIVNVLRAAGVDEWSHLPGRIVRIEHDERDRIIAIGHAISNDLWFNTEAAFEKLKKQRSVTLSLSAKDAIDPVVRWDGWPDAPVSIGVDLASGPDQTAVVMLAPDWKPIATAPRDGTQIELGGPSGYIAPNDWHVETGSWRQGTNFGWWVNDAGDAITDGWPEPTHWRPRGARPAIAGGEG